MNLNALNFLRAHMLRAVFEGVAFNVRITPCNYTFDSSGKSIVVVWATSFGIDSVDPTGISIIGWSVDTSESGCIANFTGAAISGEQKVNEKMTFAVSAENSCDNSKYYRFSMHP